MCPRSHPAHARQELPQLLSEDVLSSDHWRSRVGAAGAQSARGAADIEALERAPALTLRARLARAVRAPVLAGVAVFVVAVIATIGIAVAGSLGAQLPADKPAEATTTSPEPLVEADAVAEASLDAGADVYVHVVGAVSEPGVVKLRAGARVQDAIDAAGGATDAAVLEGVNLARVVADGEQLLVPDAEAIETMEATGPAAEGPVAHAGAGVTAPSSEGLININTADAALLETLPRVGPALAGRIIDWRTQNGGFQNVDQLLEVSGIGAKTLEGFRDRVTV